MGVTQQLGSVQLIDLEKGPQDKGQVCHRKASFLEGCFLWLEIAEMQVAIVLCGEKPGERVRV